MLDLSGDRGLIRRRARSSRRAPASRHRGTADRRCRRAARRGRGSDTPGRTARPVPGRGASRNAEAATRSDATARRRRSARPARCSVVSWKRHTRSALSGTTSARWRSGSCVATPVGQWSVWQVCAWMQPSANMKPRAALHQSAPSAIDARDVEGADDLAGGSRAGCASRRSAPTSVLCTSSRPSLQRRADVVGELQRRRAGAALGAVDDDEVGRDAGLEHRLADAEPFPRMADAQLEADRLAARQLAQPLDELHHLDRRGEGASGRAGEMQSTPTGTPRAAAISARHLGARQHAAVAGLGALADSLISIIFTCGSRACAAKRSASKRAVVVAAAEVARADLPDQVAAVLAVIAAESSPRRCRARSRRAWRRR